MTLVTRYYVVSEDNYSDAHTIPVLDSTGNTIAMVNHEFFADMSLEGTGKLNDGRILNVTGSYAPASQSIKGFLTAIANAKYHGRIGFCGLSKSGDYYMTYSVSPSPWGIGIHNSNLLPFVCCASDQVVYPYGTVLFIAELRDKTMPDGTTHAGYVECLDTGSAIVGQHIDLFCGLRKWSRQLILPDNVNVEVYTKDI